MTAWPILFLSAMLQMAPDLDGCSILEAAHQSLLESSFSTERHFTFRLNGELKVREVTRLTYENGKLTRKTIEKEVFDDGIVLEEGEDEAALVLPFECSRLKWVDERTVELSNSAGTEKVSFIWDGASGTLRPALWINNEVARFLWKKFKIESVAEYKVFEWH